MTKDLHEQLLARTRELKALVSNVSTPALVWRVLQTANQEPELNSASGMLSAYKQCLFLLRLMLTTQEPRAYHPLTENHWEKARALLYDIFDIYVEMFWPPAGRSPALDEDHDNRKTTAVFAFLHYFNNGNNGTFASVEQLLEQARSTLSPFDSALAQATGLTASDAIRTVESILRRIQDQLDRHTGLLSSNAELRQKSVTEKWDTQRFEEAFVSLLQAHGEPRFPLTVRLTELAQEFGQARAEAFWKLFVSERKQSDELPYMTESNPLEEQPLILMSSDEALCATGPLLALALTRRLGGILMQAEPLRSQVIARRDRALEQRVLNVFRDFLGDAATYLPSAYEQPDSHYEHDLIILMGDKILIVEAKASPPVEPFRDPEKAYLRIRDHFRSKRGPQKAHDQANQLRRTLLSQKRLTLFRKDGSELATLEAGPSSQVFCICVTADSYGILATDLSLLLEKPANEPYSWVVGINDLEAFLKGLRRKNWGADQLATFLKQRADLHGHILTTDELEIAGLFLLYGTLETHPFQDVESTRPAAKTRAVETCRRAARPAT